MNYWLRQLGFLLQVLAVLLLAILTALLLRYGFHLGCGAYC